MARTTKKSTQFLRSQSFQGRKINLYRESFTDRRGKRHTRIVARIGEGYTKDKIGKKPFYKVHPKGSFITWRTSRRKQDTDLVINKAADKIKITLVRKGLVERIKRLDAPFNVEDDRILKDRQVDYKLRANFIEVRSSSRLPHPGRVGAIFEVRFVDHRGMEQVRRVDAWSSRTFRRMTSLKPFELRKMLKQAARHAVARVVREESIESDSVFLAEPISKPMYWYDINKKSGTYRTTTKTRPVQIGSRVVQKTTKTRPRIRGFTRSEIKRFKQKRTRAGNYLKAFPRRTLADRLQRKQARDRNKKKKS